MQTIEEEEGRKEGEQQRIIVHVPVPSGTGYPPFKREKQINLQIVELLLHT
jgi:hypothetical protein